jgi:maltooligosyltrehalose trehalohydrolase
MHKFSVWAPRAKSMRVQVDDERYPMQRGEHGWWSADVESAGHGSDYAFLLDDDPHPYPDPRSLWQPHGVHATSRVLDHARFQWSDQQWLPASLAHAVIYELHIGTFTPEGTFVAVIEKLAYLRELGITHVELMPVNAFPGLWGWGYDGVAIYAPQEEYGGPDGLKYFVDACHAKGLGVLLDVVYNHFGPDGNYTGQFGPYITQNHHTPWGGAVNFEEQGSYEVRRFFCDNALMWLRDYHFDGLRLDAIHAFVDRSAMHFLEQLAREVSALSEQMGRQFVLIAESDLNDPRVVTPILRSGDSRACPAGGYDIDAQWSDDFHHALFAFLTGERSSYYHDFGSLAQVAKSLTSVYVYDGQYSEYRERLHGRPIQGLSAHRFLGYIQNHDQVGNRGFGDRLHANVGIRKAKLAAALVLTAPFVPMIFQGEEFASSSPFLYFADHDDPELARAVSEGRCREHASDGSWDTIPDPESEETFLQSKLHWDECDSGDHATMFDWYRSLIHLRASHASLVDGDLENVHVRFNEAEKWLIVQRGPMQLFFNFDSASASFPVVENAEVSLASEPQIRTERCVVVLPAESFVAVLTPGA